ncbi:MAG TPA: hypothetical protein PLG43_13345 [Spirochaetia bacterium]|nr:hypothetical protein [Spirochaetia bacterium]
MENPSVMIAELNERIGKNNQAIIDYKKIIGKALSKLDISLFKGSLLEVQHTKTTEVMLDLQAEKDRRAQYEEIKARVDEENSRIKKLDGEIREKEKEFAPHYGKLGEIAYRYFKENPEAAEPYEGLFRDLVACEGDIGRIQKSIIESERASIQKNAFFKFFDVGKKFYQQGALKSKQKRYENLLILAGRNVASSEFFSLLNAEAVSQGLVQKIADMKVALKKLEDDRAEMVKVRDEYMLKLEAITGGEKIDRFAAKIEDSINAKEKVLNACYINFADMYLENQKLLKIHEIDEAVVRNVRVIQALQKENREYEKLLRRFKASLEIQGIRKKIDAHKKRIEMLEKEIAKRIEEKESTIKMIHQLEEEEKKQEEIRGPEETLVLQSEDVSVDA